MATVLVLYDPSYHRKRFRSCKRRPARKSADITLISTNFTGRYSSPRSITVAGSRERRF